MGPRRALSDVELIARAAREPEAFGELLAGRHRPPFGSATFIVRP